MSDLVSIIIPMYNAAKYIEETLQSVVSQTYRPLEVCIFDDGSTDDSTALIQAMMKRLGIPLEYPRATEQGPPLAAETASPRDAEPPASDKAASSRPPETQGITVMIISRGEQDGVTRGPGNGRNRAVAASSGPYLCFLDADDVMFPTRIEKQYMLALRHPRGLVGSNFVRLPENSTVRYTRWCNSLTDDQLMTHRFKECTLIQPTWFISRANFDLVGGYEVPGWAEDLKFLLKHVELGGTLHKVHEALLVYRYVHQSVSSLVPKDLIRDVRLRAFETQILDSSDPVVRARWASFTIWGAGRDGKQVLKSLLPPYQRRVAGFCDVKESKDGDKVYICGERRRDVLFERPLVHFSQAKPPFLICISLDRPETGSHPSSEDNIRSLSLVEGVDYYLFG